MTTPTRSRAAQLLCGVLCLALLVALMAPRSVAKPPPSRGSDVTQQRLQPPTDDEVAAFVKAYKKIGRPSILVLCGLDARVAGMVNAGTQGVPMGKPDATGGGAVLLDTDPTGFSEQFATNLMAPLNPDGRTKFKDLGLLRAKLEEMRGSLKTAGETEAMDVLGRSLGVDLIIYAKFTPRTPAQVAADGKPFTCIIQLKRTGDAGLIPLGAFDVDGTLDNTTAQIYANVINRDILIPKFGKLDAGRDVTLGVLGVTSLDQASPVRKIIRKLDDVDGEVTQELTQTEAGEAYASYSFSMSSGDVEDLLDGFRAAVKEKLGVDVTVIKQESHTIMVRLGSAGGTADLPTWFSITETDKPSPAHDALVARLKGSPKTVAVVVNWMVESEQLGWTDYWYRGRSLAPAVGGPQGGNKLIGPQSEELDRMQGNLADLLNTVGGGAVNVVDRDAVEQAVQAEVARAGGHHDSEAVVTALKNSLKCDLIIWGKARIITGEQMGDHRLAKMTFSIYDPNSARFLGSVNWNGERASLTRAEMHGIPGTFFDEAKDPDGRNVARYVLGTLLSKWMNAKPMVDVEVRGASDFAQVQALADGLDRSVEDLGVFGVRYDNGVGSFTLAYAGSTDELGAKIRAKAASIPNAKLVEAMSNKLVFQCAGGK